MSDPNDGGYVYFDFINPAALRLLGGGFSVLDVGCGTGAFGAAATRLGNRVTGVELAAEACEVARQRIPRVIQHDVTDVAGLAKCLGERYDRIVFADILEHLPDPGRVLRDFRELLAPGGRVLVSLPNVAAWTVRIALAYGRFEYAESGILDRTHLRFFTRRSGKELLGEAGFRVERIDLNPHMTRALWPLLKSMFRGGGGDADPGAVLRSPAYRTYQNWVEPVETALARLWPGMLACQFVFEGSVDAARP